VLTQLENTQGQSNKIMDIKLLEDAETTKTHMHDECIPTIAQLQLKYGFSQECYHELSMITKQLHRPHNIK